MSAGALSDWWVWPLAVAVVVVFAAYFVHVAHRFVFGIASITRFLDGHNERRRAALDHEIKYGKPPLWLRALRVALIAALVGILGYAFWLKVEGS